MATVSSSVASGVEDPARPEHVVDEEHAVRSHARHELLVVTVVAGLVGVDEREVDGWFSGKRPQRLDRRCDAKVDAVGHTRLLPVAASDGGPLLAHVAADEPAAGRKPTGDAQGRVAGEGADLDGQLDADELREDGHERTLLGCDLHAGDRSEPRGLFHQRSLHVVGGRTVREDVVVQLRGDGDRRAVHPREATEC